MSWGAWGRQFSTQEMISQIKTTLESGITTFDHADIYGEYTTEQEFGKAFSTSGVERDKIQLISKCTYHLSFSLNSENRKFSFCNSQYHRISDAYHFNSNMYHK